MVNHRHDAAARPSQPDADGPAIASNETSSLVERLPVRLLSDDKRVITRLLVLNQRRIRSVLERILALPEAQIPALLERTEAKFGVTHPYLRGTFLHHQAMIREQVGMPSGLSEQRRLLIGAYFTMEYSIGSAALFNPSLVAHPWQRAREPGARRFLMSLRATGEGHISSIVFRKGTLSAAGSVSIDPAPQFAYWTRPEPDYHYDKHRFIRKLLRLEPHLALIRRVMDYLPEQFTRRQMDRLLDELKAQPGFAGTLELIAEDMRWLAAAHYNLSFPPMDDPCNMVIFPATEHEAQGMEDLRLTRFIEAGEAPMYYGTYTGYDGRHSLPMLLETRDFSRFRIRPLGGPYAADKGMALFPQKVDGRYLMISRHDGESLYLLRSDDLEFWEEGEALATPRETWELVQIGNSGPPLETEAGWLLLTHGVGPLREYCLSAMLLDRENPARVLGRLRQPLVVPETEERVGYVPNVVYSCGAFVHHGHLILPFAISDVATRFARVPLDALIDWLRHDGP